jgi:hypothetical protein
VFFTPIDGPITLSNAFHELVPSLQNRIGKLELLGDFKSRGKRFNQASKQNGGVNYEESRKSINNGGPYIGDSIAIGRMP